MGAAVLAGLIALSPLPADAQRANAFDPCIKQFIVHDGARIRIDNVRVIDGTGTLRVDKQTDRLLVNVRGKIGR